MPSGIYDWTLAYLGPDSPHAETLEQFAARQSARVVRLPDSVSNGNYRRTSRLGKIIARGRRAYSQYYGQSPSDYLQSTLATIDHFQPQVLLGFWGSNPLGDLQAIRKARPDLPIALVMLCHPTALTPRRVAFQNHLLVRASRHLSGIIFPSQQMMTYVKHRLGVTIPAMTVLRPTWPKSWHAQEQAPIIADEPNLIFLGRMDGGQACDNLRPTLLALADRGVIVHHVQSPTVAEPHPNLRPFPAKWIPELNQFASGFDAALVSYNTNVCRTTDRFRNTIPDRLISAVAAGVPIALPTSGYDACEAYLEEYQAVIRFDSPDELASRLKDRTSIAKMRKLAWTNRQNYTSESDDNQWVTFLRTIANR